ncbi:hypothetical protein AAA799P11_01281 [Marine Group I thaumarchaeote SCGC AAA799-P11]|uniref:Uncharacterized protein n=1 Tax=Marine Group I thaumarchaeote SCGC AAA799-P11 TaxID=1502295 RepID=A0A087RWW4_9ARCH|nr:hypothetical protein AAA799P11_01281 [Marine Group I thaumarchaeote SCGC AAA799-P11]
MQNLSLFLVFSAILGILFIPLHDSFAESVIPPRHQWKQFNDIEQLSCREGLVLLQKSNGAPACVSPTAYLKLVDRGYGDFDSKIMKNRPSMMSNLMENLASNTSIMNHWREMMQNNPTMMKNTIQDWVSKMKDNPEFLKNTLGPMTSDTELRQEMIEHMKEHPAMEQSLKEHPRWMESVHDSMMSSGMGPGMNQGMHTGMCPWCPEYERHIESQINIGFTNSDRMMNMMHHMWIDEEMAQDMHEFMLEHPVHMAHMSDQMMGPMLGFMMDDPEIRQQMIDLMLEHQDFMNSIRHNNQPE